MNVARFFLILIILVGGAVLVGKVWSSPAQKPLCEACNVVLISIDTLGAKHTSVYDESLDTTPFFKKLADEKGIVFEHAYAQAPWTLPSHTAMLTGRYPWDLGMWEALDALPESADTLAERFVRAGYTTALFSNGAFVHPEWQFDQGFEEAHGSFTEDAWNDLPGLFEEGGAWALSKKDGGKPFFLMLRPFEVHDPYGTPGAEGIDIHEIVDENTKLGGPTSEDADRFRTAYHTEVRKMDRALEELFGVLEASGLMNNTVVIITSDHGEEFGEHGTIGLHSIALYDESIHVPFVLVIPGTKPTRVPATIEVRSTPATLLEAVGAGASTALMADSVLPFVNGKEIENRIALSRTMFERDTYLPNIEVGYTLMEKVKAGTEIPRERVRPYTAPYASAATEGHIKVINQADGTKEVYDRASDPGETQNLHSLLHTLSLEERGTIAKLFLALVSSNGL